MYHVLNCRKWTDDKTENVFSQTVSFRTQDIHDISIIFDVVTREPQKAFLTLSSTGDNGESSVYTFSWENNPEEVEMLAALQSVMRDTKAYFEDEQGNIFPFDKILYVNAGKTGFVMAPGIDISLHPTKEWIPFVNDYRNWLDLTK